MTIPFRKLDKLFILSFVFLSFWVFIPGVGLKTDLSTLKIIHAFSYSVLGLFFEIPELGLGMFCLWAAGNTNRLFKNWPRLRIIYRIRYFLTHFIAPPAGIFSIASGLALIHAKHFSLKEGWLAWIMIFSTIGLYKGIFHHNRYIARLLTLINKTEPFQKEKMETIKDAIRSPFDQALIFSEAPTYAANYILASIKIPQLVNPLIGLIMVLESWLNSGAGAGLAIVVLGAGLIWPLRILINKFSRIPLIERTMSLAY